MKPTLQAAFSTEEALVAAVRAAALQGVDVLDVYAPYPIAGLSRVSGAGASNVAMAGLWGGVIGCVAAFAFQAWSSAASWPLDIGGKPVLAWLSFVPVAFELMILCAGIAAGAVFFWGLWADRGHAPARGPLNSYPFVLILQALEQGDLDRLRDMLRASPGSQAILEVDARTVARPARDTARSIARLDLTLIGVSFAALILAGLAWPDMTQRNLAYAPDMAVSPAVGTYEADTKVQHEPGLRVPVAGTVPREFLPLHFEATEADALRAAVELQMPSAIAAGTDAARAEKSFAVFCQPCHGREGHGDGITIKRGFQPPPSLLTQHARDMKDGQMFHVLTYGQKMMPSMTPQLLPDDRWHLIGHVRRLQARLPVDPPPFGSAAPAPKASR